MISVIIPAYNSSNTIEKTLDSVRKQTFINFIKEVIVVNDGSTDNTLKILNNYSKKYSDFPLIIINQSNSGVSVARNNGIKTSKQKWIALLDSDDFWLPNKLEKQMAVIKKNNDIQFLGTNRNNENVHIGRLVNKNMSLRLLNIKNLLFKSWPSVPTVIMKKDFLEEIGLFKEGINHGEDADLWLRVAEHNQLYYIEDCLVETGYGKKSFGEYGLSANLKSMHKGVLRLICQAYKNNDINSLEKNFFILFEDIKYIRRIFLTHWRK